MDGVEDFDPSCCGLIPVRLAIVGGLRAGRPQRRGARPEPTTWASCAGYLERYRVGELRRAGRLEYEVAANWKAIAENYNECLHCPGVHPELNALSNYMSGEVDGGRRRMVRRLDDPHRRRRDDGARGRPRADPAADRGPLEATT